MIPDWAAIVWKKMPWRMRRTIVRMMEPSFTVSAAAIITNREGKVLLLDHVIRPKSGWGLPGGFLDHGEQPEEGIRREIMEETRLELFNLKMFRVRTLGSHIEILFRASTNGSPELDGQEIQGFGWFQARELPEKMNDAQKDLIESVLEAEFEKLVGAD